MHTDEAVNAYLTGELLAGEGFHYDPQDRHGPALFALAKPVAQLFGAKTFAGLTESQLRLSTVLAGTATVLFLGAGVEMFGFIACLVAALLFAVAPLPLYYNRYFIHESLFVAATLGLILSGRKAWLVKSPWLAALAGFCGALMLASKETAVIHFFALGTAAIICRRLYPRISKGIFRLQLKIMVTTTAVFICTSILLFTWFGRNWSGLADLFQAVPQVVARASGEGHEKPFFYYLALLGGGGSGGIILGLAALGIFAVGKGRTSDDSRSRRQPKIPSPDASQLNKVAGVFIVIYGLGVAIIYSAIPYKTPWLALNLWLPLVILVGIAAQWIWLRWANLSARAGILVGLAALGCLMAYDVQKWVFKFPADEKNPYAYAHTSEDLLRLPGRLAELARQNEMTNPRIAVVAADAWPLPWYLRKFPQTGFWQPGQPTGAADFFITPTDVSGELADRLKDYRPEFFGARPNVLLILWSPQNHATNHE